MKFHDQSSHGHDEFEDVEPTHLSTSLVMGKNVLEVESQKAVYNLAHAHT